MKSNLSKVEEVGEIIGSLLLRGELISEEAEHASSRVDNTTRNTQIHTNMRREEGTDGNQSMETTWKNDIGKEEASECLDRGEIRRDESYQTPLLVTLDRHRA